MALLGAAVVEDVDGLAVIEDMGGMRVAEDMDSPVYYRLLVWTQSGEQCRWRS